MEATPIRLLRILSDGRDYTVRQLAQLLNFPEDGVLSALTEARRYGVDVADSGKEMRLKQHLNWLDASVIQSFLDLELARVRIDIQDQIGSTNTELLKRAALSHDGLPVVLAAELQTAGRGRFSRLWSSGIGDSLTFSLAWPFNKEAKFFTGLSLAVGVALVRAMRNLGVTEVQLKWPNDLLWRKKKLGGVLIELSESQQGSTVVVIGVGLNVKRSPMLNAELKSSATDLASAGAGNLDRNFILAVILNQLIPALAMYQEEGFTAFKEEWELYHSHQNKVVKIVFPDGTYEEGVALGVAGDGALAVRIGGVKKIFYSGEISLRAETV